MKESSSCVIKSQDFSHIPKNFNISDDISISSYDRTQDRNFFFFEGKQILIDESLFKKGFEEKTSKETEDKENLGIKKTKFKFQKRKKRRKKIERKEKKGEKSRNKRKAQ